MSRASSLRTTNPRRRSPRAHPVAPPPRVLLTGPDSLLGSRILQRLLAASWEVVAVANTRAAGPLPPGLLRVVADRTSSTWGRWAAGCCAAVHVGPGLGERPSDDRQSHGVGPRDTAAVVDACRGQGITRVVLVTCLGAAADAASKRQQTAWQAEQTLRAASLATTVLRPAWLAGPNPSLPARLARAVGSGRPIALLGGGRYPLQTVAVDDVASAVVRCLQDAGTVGKTLELASGPSVSFLDLLHRIATATQRPLRSFAVPRRFAWLVLAWAQRRPTALLTRDELLALWAGSTADPSPGQAIFGPLGSGLEALSEPAPP